MTASPYPEPLLDGILPFGLEIPAEKRPLVVEHPAMMAVFPIHLGSDSEEVQVPVSFECDDAQCDSIGLVKGERSPVHR